MLANVSFARNTLFLLHSSGAFPNKVSTASAWYDVICVMSSLWSDINNCVPSLTDKSRRDEVLYHPRLTYVEPEDDSDAESYARRSHLLFLWILSPRGRLSAHQSPSGPGAPWGQRLHTLTCWCLHAGL